MTNLYENKDPSDISSLKNKIQNLNMHKYETMPSFFTNISHRRDQLMSIGVVVDEDNLIQTTIDGIPPLRETFLDVVNSWYEQNNFKRLWHDFLQEEGKNQIKYTYSKQGNLSITESMKRGTNYFS